MTARVGSDFVVALRVPVPGQPDLPLLECLVHRRRARTATDPRLLVLRGELCAFTSPLLRDHIEGHWSADSLLLDLGEVDLVDTGALEVCADLARRWAEAGLTVGLVHPSDQAAAVIETMGLGHLVTASVDRPADSTAPAR